MDETPHALILTGGSAAGRKAEALTRAAGLLCLSGNGVPCRSCPECRRAEAGGHPDVHDLHPEGREIVVSQVRALRAALRLKPHEGRVQIAVIEADALNVHAQNALLAILEEPPGDARFFLLSENPRMLLATVRSRCAVHRLPDPPEEEAPAAGAELLFQALLAGDEWAWAHACLSLEKTARDDLAGILGALAHLLVKALPEHDVLTARRFGGIIDKIRALQDMLDANVGAGHVCGALAAAWAAEPPRP